MKSKLKVSPTNLSRKYLVHLLEKVSDNKLPPVTEAA